MISPRTILHILREHAEQNPDHLALKAPGLSPVTYGQLYQQVVTFAKTLRENGIRKKDRVAVVLPNGPEMAVTFLGTACAACCAPLNPQYKVNEFNFYFSDLKASALITRGDFDSAARIAARNQNIPLIELSTGNNSAASLISLPGSSGTHLEFNDEDLTPENVALVLHTSGTTSKPKIVPLTHANLCHSAQNIKRTLHLNSTDLSLNVMPLFHIHGLVASLLSSLAAGASVICTPGFLAPEFFRWSAEFRPTWYTAVPTIHQSVLKQFQKNEQALKDHTFRFIRSSSSKLSPLLMDQMEKAFGVPVIEAYGMTEASHQMTSNPLPPSDRKPGSVGIPAGPEIAVINKGGDFVPAGQVGEVVIKGPNVTRGYEASETTVDPFVDGWFRTGDLGYLDTDNYLFLQGRIKEMINRGGEKVIPGEVDEILLSHPAVDQAVTFGIPDRRVGEEVGAAVVLVPGSTAAVKALKEFAAERLADYKVPKEIIIVTEIPKGPTGKIQRLGLAEKFGLPAARSDTADQPTERVLPRNMVEREMEEIFKRVLSSSEIGIHDDFFELGGDSILAARIILEVTKKFGVQIPLVSLFERPTIAEMGEQIRQMRPEDFDSNQLYAVNQERNEFPTISPDPENRFHSLSRGDAETEQESLEGAIGKDSMARLIERIQQLSEEEVKSLLSAYQKKSD